MPPEARVNLQAIADAAGVSRMTVSRALRNHPHVSEATREHIRGMAQKMGYRPDPVLSRLMTHLRETVYRPKEGTLGFITAFASKDGWKESTTGRAIEQGARARAEQLGYKLEPFWAHAPGVSPARLSEILFHRGIRGLFIAPLPEAGGTLDIDWSRFATATAGWALARPSLHRACSHQTQALQQAHDALRARGYRRIGLAIPSSLDHRLDHLWLAGTLLQAHQHPGETVPPLISDDLNPRSFGRWLKQHRPDAVLSLWTGYECLQALKVKVPEDVGFVCMNRDNLPPGVAAACIDHHSPSLGAAAIDLIAEQLRLNDYGLPALPKTVLIACSWHEGPTVRPAAPLTRQR